MGFKVMEISSWVGAVIYLDLLVPFLKLKQSMWAVGFVIVQHKYKDYRVISWRN